VSHICCGGGEGEGYVLRGLAEGNVTIMPGDFVPWGCTTVLWAFRMPHSGPNNLTCNSFLPGNLGTQSARLGRDVFFHAITPHECAHICMLMQATCWRYASTCRLQVSCWLSSICWFGFYVLGDLAAAVIFELRYVVQDVGFGIRVGFHPALCTVFSQSGFPVPLCATSPYVT